MKTTVTQLSLFGLAPDQNSFGSMQWGRLDFFPANSEKWTDTCRHCLLWVHKDMQRPDDECLCAPCSPEDRQDGRSGYFSIHQMP